MRTIYLKKKNPRYSEVSADDTVAIMVSTAGGWKPAQYRPRAEQESRLKAMYSKWEQFGGIWTALSPAAHEAQLRHVRNGCLDRPAGLEHLRAETSANELLHSQLNNVQRTAAGGVVMVEAQAPPQHAHRAGEEVRPVSHRGAGVAPLHPCRERIRPRRRGARNDCGRVPGRQERGVVRAGDAGRASRVSSTSGLALLTGLRFQRRCEGGRSRDGDCNGRVAGLGGLPARE